MKRNEVFDFFEENSDSDSMLKEFEEIYEPLSDFILDVEYLKGIKNLSQKEIAKKAKTTQSSISRFENMSSNPGYKFFVKISKALDNKLYITPLGDQTVTVPYDLHDKIALTAKQKGISIKDLLTCYIREGVHRDNFVLINKGKESKRLDFDRPVFKIQKKDKSLWEM